jgi:hypothetical protein
MSKLPSESRLATLKDGYQLFQETRTGLFYLTAHSEPLRRRPDFAGFLEGEITHSVDVSALKRYLSEGNSALDIKDYEVSFKLIQRTASLSEQLNIPVLAAEITDDEYGMAVMVNERALQYVRFRTSQRGKSGDEAQVEVTYTPEAGFGIDHEPAEQIYGLAQTAIEDVFQVAGLALHNYVETKPSREEVKQEAENISSIKTYRDSFGVFKRLSHARPQVTVIERMLLPFRYAVSFCLLPFLLVGMTTFAVLNSDPSRKHSDAGPWQLFLIGFAVLAIPILFFIWVIRSTIGF